MLLDDAFFIGLYLCILDRKDLSMKHSGYYKTWEAKGGSKFFNAHEMAKKIKEYSSTKEYLIIITSQYRWEAFFSKELGDVLVSCGAFNI